MSPLKFKELPYLSEIKRDNKREITFYSIMKNTFELKSVHNFILTNEPFSVISKACFFHSFLILPFLLAHAGIRTEVASKQIVRRATNFVFFSKPLSHITLS